MKFFKSLLGNREQDANAATPQQVFDQTYRFVALDVETANSDAGSICQIGLALVDQDAEITVVDFLVDPEQPFSSFNTNLHGISAETVAGHPTFEEVFQPIRAFLARHPLVQHSTFDKRAIDGACALYGLPAFQGTWFNSVTIARRAWPELKGNGGHGLASLKTFLGLEFDHHDAAEDARAAAQVVLKAEQHLGQQFEDIAQSKPQSARRYEKSVALAGNQTGPLYGHVACFTGKLTMSRTEASTLAAGCGISVKTTVSKKVTLLVVGDQDLTTLAGHEKSSKHRRAEELIDQGHTIKILGETEFRSLIQT